jgi:UDP-N-acetylbacillosamine N-acetyltransferase
VARVAIFGAGGHGSVVADAALCAGWDVLGFLDDGRPVGQELSLGRVLGGRAWCSAHPDVAIALAIGDNRIRQQLAEELTAAGAQLATIVHPSAVVARTAQLGAGAAVLALAVINAGARVESGAIVNSAAVVEHDAWVGPFAHVSPRAVLAGAARLGEQSQLGAGACVLPGISVGPRCLVGAGAVVTRDVPAHSVCVGVPARVTRQLPG